ncbi:hypothetical protein CLG85_008745 [Yangia mangrovi]|uniref:Uncharacterized protein n=1 Tax=Alloyangia mangrovi TaxID=1779329 RepID=A0ABT2KJ66_9RHOB|nr:hypothetical protein [Alloyangia mangrovi]MCT4370403.1 hypothetical protein [Alloyangia mangrovi]
MRLVLLTLLALTGACTDFPEFDGSQSPGVAGAPWPRLVPLSGLLEGQPPARTQPEMAEDLDYPREALRRRASAAAGARWWTRARAAGWTAASPSPRFRTRKAGRPQRGLPGAAAPFRDVAPAPRYG